jgi:hypothetical protein
MSALLVATTWGHFLSSLIAEVLMGADDVCKQRAHWEKRRSEKGHKMMNHQWSFPPM